MIARRILAGSLLVGSLILTSGASAKDFKPGDLSVCDAKRCVSIKSRPVLNALSVFYYDSAVPPAPVRAPGLGMPFFRLEFSNGYVTGIIASAELNRFLSYGVNLDQFRAGVWYRVPPRAVAGLRELTVGFTPLRLTSGAIASTSTFGVQSSAASEPPPRTQRRAGTGDRGSAVPWPLAVVSLTALIALASLARRRRRSGAASLPTLRTR
jgi:hypothetical protein